MEGSHMHRSLAANALRNLWIVVLGGAVMLAAPSLASANPKNIAPGSKLVFNFNLIGYPAGNTYEGNCGDGHRIFVNREANNAYVEVTNSISGWSILDCNATSDHSAVLATNEVGMFDIYARILGKPGGHISVCGDL